MKNDRPFLCLSLDLEVGRQDARIQALAAVRADADKRLVFPGDGLSLDPSLTGVFKVFYITGRLLFIRLKQTRHTIVVSDGAPAYARRPGSVCCVSRSIQRPPE